MLKKRIVITNVEAIAEAIKTAEGKATARTLDVKKIQKILDGVSNGSTKTAINGTKVHYDGAQHFPNAYKYRPESTHFTAENVRGKWYVTDIYRDTCPNRVKNTQVTYSEDAIKAILENARYCEY